MLVVLARQLAERAVLVPQVVRVVVLPLHGTMPNPASLRGSCEQRQREEGSSVPIQHGKQKLFLGVCPDAAVQQGSEN